MKLCKDCKYFVESEDFACSPINRIRYGKCSYKEQNGQCDLVDGSKKEPWRYASVQRMFPKIIALIFQECGNNGRYFEPKQ